MVLGPRDYARSSRNGFLVILNLLNLNFIISDYNHIVSYTINHVTNFEAPRVLATVPFFIIATLQPRPPSPALLSSLVPSTV